MKTLIVLVLFLLAASSSCHVSGVITDRGTLRIYLDGPIAPMPPIDGPEIAPNELSKMPTVTPDARGVGE